jgi:hypothetical protein
MRMTFPEFKSRMYAFANESGTVLERATGTASNQIKREIVASARSRVRHTPKAKAGWVKYDVKKVGDGAESEIRLRGGFAVLADKGSYKKPQGYTVQARVRSVRQLANRRGWIGPFHHPYIPAQPFSGSGIAKAWPSVARTYHTAVNREVLKHFP